MRLFVALGAVSCLAVLAPLAARVPAQSPAPTTAASDATAKIVAAAQAFLAALDDAGRAKAQLPADSPQKGRWSNFPTGIYERHGARMGDLTPAQHAAAMAVLAAAFSQDGYRKVVEMVKADEVLRGAPNQGPPPARSPLPTPSRAAPSDRSAASRNAGSR